MKYKDEQNLVLKSFEQLYLYGFNYKFDLFKKLFINKKMPKCTLFTGPKGIGKATFAYHLVNYILSLEEKHSYSVVEHKINSKNQSFNLLNSNIHPNFYLLNTVDYEGEIKIEHVRNLLRFLRNTTYNNNFKLVLIDNIENLNQNSSNALLKCLEEPTDNTFFLLIHDESKKILNTIKSRCVEFRFHLNDIDKYSVFSKLTEQYFGSVDLKKIFDYFYFETPGNLIKYISLLKINKIDVLANKLNTISYLIEKYLKEDDTKILSFISVFIEKFYSDLYLSNINKINIFYYNKNKIMNLLNEMKIYNLDKKNTFLGIKAIIQADAR